MLQCVAVCCSVVRCVAVCCSVLQCGAVCVQCAAVCCSALQCPAVHCSVLQSTAACRSGLLWGSDFRFRDTRLTHMCLQLHMTAHTVERPTTLLNSQRTEVMGCAGMRTATAGGAHIASPAAPFAAGEERERERERR